MLGSIIRILIFMGLVGGATWGIFQLLKTPGGITITFADYELYLTPLAFAAGLLALFLGLWLLFKLARLILAVLRFLTGDETALTRYFERGRTRRGLEALSKGMVAVAAGDAKTATKTAAKAERLLRRPELTRLLNAQAADLAGDKRKARNYYRALAAEPDTAFVGIKGLLTQALEAGDTERALKLAHHGFVLQPKDQQVLDTLYGLQSEAFDWEGARKTLTMQSKAGYLPKPEASAREATLALAQAEDAVAAKNPEQAKKHALEAAKLDPGNPEAVAAAVRHLIAEGSKRAASRQVIAAWKAKPDAQLAAVFAEIEPEETLERRRKRFDRLFEANPAHDETRFLRAELALTAQDWPGAKAAIQALAEDEPSARSCAIMAAIARGEGEPDHVVRGWLARAIGAPRGTARDGEIGQAAMLPLLMEEPEPAEAEDAAIPEAETPEATGPDAEPVPPADPPEPESAPGPAEPEAEPDDAATETAAKPEPTTAPIFSATADSYPVEELANPNSR